MLGGEATPLSEIRPQYHAKIKEIWAAGSFPGGGAALPLTAGPLRMRWIPTMASLRASLIRGLSGMVLPSAMVGVSVVGQARCCQIFYN